MHKVKYVKFKKKFIMLKNTITVILKYDTYKTYIVRFDTSPISTIHLKA